MAQGQNSMISPNVLGDPTTQNGAAALNPHQYTGTPGGIGTGLTASAQKQQQEFL